MSSTSDLKAAWGGMGLGKQNERTSLRTVADLLFLWILQLS